CLGKQPVPPEETDGRPDQERVEVRPVSIPGLIEPLNRVLEITRLLSTAPPEPKAAMEIAGQAHQVAAQLHRTIGNCLAYAEIERLATDWERLEALQEHRISIRHAVHACAVENTRSLGRTTDLALTLEDAVVAMSDEHLHKIAEELLDNAFRYSRPGSAVQLSTTTDGDRVTLAVRDHGAGMTPEQIARAGTPIPLDQMLL